MRFHILTLFPDMVMDGLNTSILGRAMESGAISAEAINIRDYSRDKHGHVDDTPYGGGAGMVMQAMPVFDAYEDLCRRLGKRPRVIYTTPQGRVFDQAAARELAREEDLVFLCGHYEGIDERALELVATDFLSIGDYVLTGGELPAMVMIDSISRLVPGVLNNETSAEFESFHDNLLEYPQYTRPEKFMGRSVPGVLLTGHHKNIDEWRRRASIDRTLARRPELLRNARLTVKEKKYLGELLEEGGREASAAAGDPRYAGNAEKGASGFAMRGGWRVTDLSGPSTAVEIPSILINGRKGLDAIPVSHFIGTALAVDVRGLAAGDAITMDVLEPLRELADQADYVLFCTGAGGGAASGREVGSFPSLDPRAANYLLKSGKRGVGTDAPVLASEAAVRDVLYRKFSWQENLAVIVNLAGLSAVCDRQTHSAAGRAELFDFIALPIKGADGGRAPARAVAVDKRR